MLNSSVHFFMYEISVTQLKLKSPFKEIVNMFTAMNCLLISRCLK